MNDLLESLHTPFMQHALWASLLVGVTCSVLGVYVVFRRMAFIGDALAHTALPGLVIAHFQGWSLFLGALVADLFTALGIGFFSNRRGLREDTAIGVLFTGMFAAGILLMTMHHSFRDLTDMLFGNVLLVTGTDLALMSGVAAIVLAVVVLFYKELELTSFDPGYAEVIGLRASLLRYVLLVLLALTVVAGIQVVGVVLTSALLVTPAATASMLVKRLRSMMIVASLVGVGSCVAGLYVSFEYSWSSGAAIVVACTACFVAAYLWRGMRDSWGKRASLRGSR